MVPNVLSEARTKEILCKPVEEQSIRLTTGFRICGTTAALRSWLLTSVPSPTPGFHINVLFGISFPNFLF